MEGNGIVSLFPIDLGIVHIYCPGCEMPADQVYVGISTLEDTEDTTESELPHMEQIGIIAYPCGDVFGTTCLAEKVARILNARDNGQLRLSMLHNLIECKEHGVEYPNQS